MGLDRIWEDMPHRECPVLSNICGYDTPDMVEETKPAEPEPKKTSQIGPHLEDEFLYVPTAPPTDDNDSHDV